MSVFQISDVARGLEYLHSREPPICHGDLKSVSRDVLIMIHVANKRPMLYSSTYWLTQLVTR